MSTLRVFFRFSVQTNDICMDTKYVHEHLCTIRITIYALFTHIITYLTLIENFEFVLNSFFALLRFGYRKKYKFEPPSSAERRRPSGNLSNIHIRAKARHTEFW